MHAIIISSELDHVQTHGTVARTLIDLGCSLQLWRADLRDLDNPGSRRALLSSFWPDLGRMSEIRPIFGQRGM
jgi:hypothetical protein